MEILLLAPLSYLYGAIPFGLISARLIKKQRLNKEGTGNITVTNAFKVGGVSVGIITLLGEVSKAVLPIGTAKLYFQNDLYAALLLLYLSLVGTCFSVFLKGRGGMGSTTAMWGLLLLSPYTCLLLLLITLLFIKIAKKKTVLKRIPLYLIPVIIYLVERDFLFAFFGLLTCILFVAVRLKRKDDFAHYGIFHKSKSFKDSDRNSSS